MATALLLLISYLLGTIPFGLIIPRFFGIPDIRQHGSGNIGATNVLRTLGWKAAIWVFIGDIGKGIVAVVITAWAAKHWGITSPSRDVLLILSGCAAIVGHIFPFYLKFKGGKGVNTALGVMVTLLPVHALIALGIFLIMLFLFRFVSLASMTAAFGFFLSVTGARYLLHQSIPQLYAIIALLVAVVVIYTHRTNIARLLNGTENRISFSGKKRG